VLVEREPRPHLDLAGAAECQLVRGGVQQVHTLSVCTHCSPDWLWSYRRDKASSGRNWTFAWRHRNGGVQGEATYSSDGVAPDGSDRYPQT
jgi:copper oxidase (laccase) domain-containing protein